MKKHEEMDLGQARLYSVAERPSKVDQDLMAGLGDGSVKGYF